MIGGEHLTRTSKTVDDLVCDQQRAVLVTNFTKASPIPIRRNDNAVGGGDRLGDDGGDGLRVFVFNHLADLIGA